MKRAGHRIAVVFKTASAATFECFYGKHIPFAFFEGRIAVAVQVVVLLQR